MSDSMTNTEGEMPNAPEGRTRLKAGAYTLICSGPDGIILNLTVDLARRTTFECLLDDERLQELLVVNSVATGLIEAELHKLHKEGSV